MPHLGQQPAPGSHHVCHCGDVVVITLDLPEKLAGRGWVRTNLGRAAIRRGEIRAFARHHEPVLHRDWHDIPMTRVSDRQCSLTLPLVEVGRFEAKAFFLEKGKDEPLWPEGSNTVFKVEPADTVCANTLYTAFVRQFGPNRDRVREDDPARTAIGTLETAGYTVIPRSGTFRDLIPQLDFILGTLGFRILQLLPIHPVPTTYARMGRFGSPFAALDYWNVDPALAEFDRRTTPLQQFIELVDAVHARGGKLFMDMPINHTGWASRLQVHHPEWFARNADASFTSPGAWGVTWEDLSKLDYRHHALWTHIADVLLHWCRQGVDGFRCDAGYMIPLEVWEYLVAEVRAQYPDTIFLLEGLGGPAPAVNALLDAGNLDWAYSELFQCDGRDAVVACVQAASELAAARGLYVHYAETHDNNRLAARSTRWADMRTALAALCAPAGGFGITNGVEWHATEKVEVHGATALAWGNPDNQVGRLQRLGALLKRHPAFFAGAHLRTLPGAGGTALVVRRESQTQTDPLLILINLDDQHPATAVWPAAQFSAAAGDLHDLLSGEAVPVVTQDGQGTYRLEAGAVRCLTADASWLARLESSAAAELGPEPERIILQRYRAKVLDVEQALHGFGDVSALDVARLAGQLAKNPLQFMESLSPSALSPVTRWVWPHDQRRVVMVPPGHALLIELPADGRVELRRGELALYRDRALPLAEGGAFVLIPPRPVPAEAEPVTLALTVFQKTNPEHATAGLLYLTRAEQVRIVTRINAAEALRVGAYAIATNSIGAMAQVRADWGALRSQYDAVLAANLNPDFPVDRRVMFTRCRAWLVFRGYSQPLNAECLDGFASQPDGTVVWWFSVPAGLGKLVSVEVTLRLASEHNAVTLTFRRLPTRTPEHLAPDHPVRLILRPDLEDRVSHDKTKAYLGPERAWPGAVRAAADGFHFAPSPDRPLHMRVQAGAFTSQPEWTYMAGHPEEAERGLDAHSDLFSPGYFTGELHGRHAVMLESTIGAEPDSRSVGAASLRRAAARDSMPLPDALRDAMQAYIVKRGGGLTVIAGYPWFLDWGRDTMICLRGIIAAGMLKEAKAILGEFARFEDRGTLPNVIHGADASNRDTSDAPLWFFTACADVCTAERSTRFLSSLAGGRRIAGVLQSMARSIMSGTPNGIRMDPDSGLVFSPAHFTWMDTNFPAATPREGYPIEIQALWHAALRLLARHEAAGPWEALAGRVADSIHRYYPRADAASGGRFLADCLHAHPGEPAARARVDDALRPNQLLAITLGVVTDAALRADILRACETLLVPGAIRSLADRPVTHPIPVVRDDGRLLNAPLQPYWGHYEGDEDTRRKPAYHNGTAWTWLFPSYSEALFQTYGEPARATAAALLGSAAAIINRDCLRQVPEILDGDAPHRSRGCGAQAWGVTELYRVLGLLTA